MKKMLAHPEPPGYWTKATRPRLDAFIPILRQMLVADRSAPRAGSGTLFDRLQADRAFIGGYTGIKEAVRRRGTSTNRCSCR